MHFFRSREDAESWVEGRGALAVLTIEEGCVLFEVACDFFNG